MRTKSKVIINFLKEFFTPAYLICLAVLGVVVIYLVLAGFRTRDDAILDAYDAFPYNTGWKQVFQDGTEAQVQIPGKLKVTNGFTRIDNTIPDVVHPGYYAAVRADRQETEIYIDDILRRSFSEDGRYHVFVSLTPEDAGKRISVRFRNKSLFNEVPVYDIYLGEEAGIWYLIGQGPIEMVALAVVGLAASALLFFAAMYLSFRDRTLNDLIFLSLTGVAFGFWEFMSSIMFQFFADSTTVPYNASYMIACFMQMPLIVYVDKLKERRYSHILEPLFIFNLASGAVLVLLNASGIASFNKTCLVVAVVQMIVGGVIAMVFRTDVKKGYVQNYQAIMTGFFVFAVMNTLEFLRLLIFSMRGFAGISALGVAALITFAVLNSLLDYSRVRSEKDTALRLKELRSSFLAAMSHEIRTPINTIISLNDAILQEETDAKVLYNARMIRDSSKELLLLVNDILDISRSEAGRFKSVQLPMRPMDCVTAAVSACSDRAKEAGLKLTISNTGDEKKLYLGDSKQIENVLQNLISFFVSGIRSSQSSSGSRGSGEITISSQIGDGGVFISVSCAPEGVKNLGIMGNRDIFTHTADVLLKNLGSSLMEQKEEGVTNAFSFSLFLPAAPDSAEILFESTEPTGTTDFKGVCILVADDQDVNRLMLRKTLKKTGAEVIVAASGQEAIDLTFSRHFDIVLMDVRMPGISGIEAMRTIKNLSRVPVVAFTANNDVEEQEELIKMGFDAYISKPVVPDVLYSIIRQLLEDTDNA